MGRSIFVEFWGFEFIILRNLGNYIIFREDLEKVIFYFCKNCDNDFLHFYKIMGNLENCINFGRIFGENDFLILIKN